jgi:hypothetical protein
VPNSGRCPSGYSCIVWQIPSRLIATMIAELVYGISL